MFGSQGLSFFNSCFVSQVCLGFSSSFVLVFPGAIDLVSSTSEYFLFLHALHYLLALGLRLSNSFIKGSFPSPFLFRWLAFRCSYNYIYPSRQGYPIG